MAAKEEAEAIPETEATSVAKTFPPSGTALNVQAGETVTGERPSETDSLTCLRENVELLSNIRFGPYNCGVAKLETCLLGGPQALIYSTIGGA